MLIDRKNEKLVNAIIFFVENTNYCGKTKLFKLLYFLDFEHFSKTGRSVTGLEYFAWPMGPVPKRLFEEIDNQTSLTSQSLEIVKRNAGNEKVIHDFNAKHEFKSHLFSKRELKLLNSLAEEYSNSYANDMIEATHLENQPWHEIYEKIGAKQQLIPYELALKKAEYEQVLKNVTEHQEIEENYK